MMRRRITLGLCLLVLAQPAMAQEPKQDCAPSDLEALAGWGGVWAAESIDAAHQGLSGRDSNSQALLLGLSAPWTDLGRARMLEMTRRISAGTIEQATWGFPMMMNSYAEFTIVIAPVATVIINQTREVRTIYTDGRGHLPEDVRWPTNWGDSVGCWEDETLVVETVSARYDPLLHPFAPPLSDNAHFIERLRMVEPGKLENVITITDPAMLTEPWTVEVHYVDAGIDRVVQDAFVDRNDTVNATIIDAPPGFDPAPLPPPAALSDAELDRLAGRYQVEGAPLVMLVERDGNRLLVSSPPVDPGRMAMYPDTPLCFTTLFGNAMEFTLDADGAVTGLTGTAPGGAPFVAARLDD